MRTGSGTLAPPSRSTGRGGADPHDDGHGGGGSDWVELTRARDDIDAHLLAGRLLEAGIETRAVKDRFAPGAWLYGGSNPWAPVTIMVHRVQLDDARLVLAEISYEAPSADTGRTSERRERQNPVAWWVAAVVLAALVTAIFVSEVGPSDVSCRSLCPDPIWSQE
jgi:hypothetical protein